MYQANPILNRREKPLEEADETVVGEGRELHRQKSPSQELLAKATGNGFSIQLVEVIAEHSASPTSDLELIKSYIQSSCRLEYFVRIGRIAGQ